MRRLVRGIGVVVAGLVIGVLVLGRRDVAPSLATTIEARFPGPSGDLRGIVMRPAGEGPFPVLVYNHGSERSPSLEYSGELGRWFQEHGFVVFFPYRRGASGSAGTHWEDALADAAVEDRESGIVAQLDLQSDDVLAAIAWIRTQPYVDGARVSVAGCSFGGIETVLAAERAPGLHAAVDFAGASMSWAGSPPLQARLRRAVNGARAPIFFVQAANDFDTTPSRELSAEMMRAHLPNAVRIFPPHGKTHAAGHAHFCNHGMSEWGEAVLAFLAAPPAH